MIFKNAVIYRFTQHVFRQGMETELADFLTMDGFTPVQSSQRQSLGWVPAIAGADELVTEVNGCLFVRLRKDEKVLKPSAINREVNDRIEDIKRTEGRIVRKKEREEIRDIVIAHHLPHAMVESKYTVAYIDTVKQWLVVDAGSFKAAEELTSYLRKTLGSLPIRSLQFEVSPGTVLTNTLTPGVGSYLTNYFEVGRDCDMTGVDGANAKFRDMDLSDTEVTDHITEGQMTVSSLALNKGDLASFNLVDGFVLKRVKFLDGFKDKVLDYDPESVAEDAGLAFVTTNLFLMTAELREVFDWLIESMGGEEESFDPMEGL